MIFYASDFHAEIRGSSWRKHLQSLIEKHGDHLKQFDIILAGDNGSFLDLSFKTLVDAFAMSFRHVYFLLGNHEFFGLSYELAIEKAFHLESLFHNVTFLHRKAVQTLDGYLLLGATLWSDASRWTTKELYDIENGIGDFHKIQKQGSKNVQSNGSILWNADLMTEVHQEDLLFLENSLKENKNDNSKTIVVTHFGPLELCNPKEFSGSKQSRQFCNDLSSLLQTYKPKAWIYGHVHGGNESFQFDETTVTRACIGYSFEEIQGQIDKIEM